ncbi:rust resistance kinase Lr10 [Arachis hypogaea]|uniref:rust resistance kinase Lr10 n=1 Tax=Arachis hypogaea TaxID=3818 RepID=UPI000DED6533
MVEGYLVPNMISNSNSLMLMMVLILVGTGPGICHGEDGCGGHRCGRHGPPIRFPFRLKDKEPPHCGYPAFDLTCSDSHDTFIEFSASPVPLKLLVTDIQYEYNYFRVSDTQNCLPTHLLKLIKNSSSISPFQFSRDQTLNDVSFFNCSPDPQYQLSCPIYVADSYDSLLSSNLVSCTKIFDISSTFYDSEMVDLYNTLNLWWSKPNCSMCETQGKRCKLKNNGTQGEVECFRHHHNNLLFDSTGVVAGLILLAAVATAVFKIYQHFRMKGEDRARIDKFLEDYRALKPTRFSYADVKRITNGFKDKLGEGGHGAVFKGMLSSEIGVAVKILNSNTEGKGKDFTNEVGTMGKIHHVNVVRLLGFCAQGVHCALVYDFFPKGSLQNFISTPDNKDVFLGWEKLHQIALGVARGIEYLHHGCEQQILHFDINPHNILLDDNFTPKITDFGLAKLCSKDQSKVSMTAAKGTMGYIAPEIVSRNFGNVSYKADIYSYGILLLEMVGGRKNIEMEVEGSLRILYPEWMHNLLDGGDFHVHIEDEEDNKLAKKIAIVGLQCIQWQPSDRPSIKTVISMLEGDADKLNVPRNLFDLTNSISRGRQITHQTRPLNLELERIKIFSKSSSYLQVVTNK